MSPLSKKQIDLYLRGLTSDATVLGLLAGSLGRVLEKAAQRGERWQNLFTLVEADHITDWLTAASINRAPWTQRLDDRGIPLKLGKFGTVAQIVDEADKAMRRMSTGMSRDLATGDEAIVMELDGGYRVVKLLTTASLDVESARMQHCIGQGAYDAFVERPDLGTAFYSLRDAGGKPHVTIQLDPKDGIQQIQGKQNKAPGQKYVEKLAPFFRQQGIAKTSHATGMVFDGERNLREVTDLPEGIVIPGDLVIHPTRGLRLPKRMTVQGHFSLTDAADVTMPEELTVGGDMRVCLSREVTAVRDLKVGGHLRVGMCTFDRIADRLTVKDLTLTGNKIRTIAETASISGDLVIESGGLEDIDCVRKVGGDLTLSKCNLERLPDGLNVGGSFSVIRGRFESLPSSFRAGGSVSITWSWLESLPDGFHCNGDLTLRSSVIDRLPEGLRVKGSLDIAATRVSFIPDDAFIGDGLDISHTMISRLPDTMRVVDGSLNLTGTSVATVPYGLDIAVDLITRESALQEVPEGVTVGRRFICNDPA